MADDFLLLFSGRLIEIDGSRHLIGMGIATSSDANRKAEIALRESEEASDVRTF